MGVIYIQDIVRILNWSHRSSQRLGDCLNRLVTAEEIPNETSNSIQFELILKAIVSAARFSANSGKMKL